MTLWPSDRERAWETLGPTWIEVDLGVLAANFTEIAAFVRRPLPERAAHFIARHGLLPPSGPPKIMVVVKADAYGHGAVETARTAVEAGADMLGVSTLLEALELRQAGVTAPILMFNPITPAEAETAVRYGVTATVTDLDAATSLSTAAQRYGSSAYSTYVSTAPGLTHGPIHTSGLGGAPVHISIDTGMSRYGLAPEAAAAFAETVAAMPGLVVEGLYTHFSAGADYGAASLVLMRRQLDSFGRAVAAVEATGLVVPLRHAACSSAIIRLPESYLDMVRVGNLFYGFGPAGAADRTVDTCGGVPLPRVRKAWSMVTRVLEVRDVPAGTGVGYGPDVTLRRPARLATVPVGYADGVGAEVQTTTFRPRVRLRLFLVNLLDGLGRRGLLPGPLARLRRRAWKHAVFFHNSRPLDIVGRISMQQTILDVTARPEIAVGTPVHVRIRRVLANPRLPRVYLLGGEAIAMRTVPGLAAAAAARDSAGDARRAPQAASAGRRSLPEPRQSGQYGTGLG